MAISDARYSMSYNPNIISSAANMKTVASSLMHTLQPVSADALWSEPSTPVTATNDINGNTSSLIGNTGPFYMPSLPAMSSGLQSLAGNLMPYGGYPYNLMFPTPQPVTATSLENAAFLSQSVPTNESCTTSRDTSNPIGTDGNNSPFQTVNRLALDSAEPMFSTPDKPKSGTRPKVTKTPCAAAGSNGTKPPKRPLTSYMRFSKAMWAEVRQKNPDMSVCNIGVEIGKLWRQLTDEQKKIYFDEFTRGKSEYDDELKAYLNTNGMSSSDLPKPKIRSKKDPSATPKRSHKKGQSSPETACDYGIQAANQMTDGLNQQQSFVNGIQQQQWLGSKPSAETIEWVQQQQQQQHGLFASNQIKLEQTENGGIVETSPGNHSTAPNATVTQQSDGMVVLHLRTDDSPDCHAERSQRADHVDQLVPAPSHVDVVRDERCRLLGLLNEQLNTVKELKGELRVAYARINELEQQNDLLRQLRDASAPVSR